MTWSGRWECTDWRRAGCDVGALSLHWHRPVVETIAKCGLLIDSSQSLSSSSQPNLSAGDPHRRFFFISLIFSSLPSTRLLRIFGKQNYISNFSGQFFVLFLPFLISFFFKWWHFFFNVSVHFVLNPALLLQLAKLTTTKSNPDAICRKSAKFKKKTGRWQIVENAHVSVSVFLHSSMMEKKILKIRWLLSI